MPTIDRARSPLALRALVPLCMTLPAVAGSTWQENFQKICNQPMPLIELLRARRIRADLDAAAEPMIDALAERDLLLDRKADGDRLRVGGKWLARADVDHALQLGDERSEAWLDVISFASEAASQRFVAQANQGHSGRNGGDGYLTFFTSQSPAGMDAVAICVRNGRVVINAGVAVPFAIRPPSQPQDAAELAVIDAKIDVACDLLHAAAQAVIDPGEITWIPPAHPDAEEVRWLRVASFARLWSEVKYNFVFLDRRPELDWDHMLERFLPRVAAATSQADYVRVLEEAMALLRDGHTSVLGEQGEGATDSVPLRLEPVDGVPTIVELGTTAAIRESGLQPGMELVAVNDVPVGNALEQARSRVCASTPQDRDLHACEQLLRGPALGTIRVTFRDGTGAERSLELACNSSTSGGDVPWRHRPAVDFRDLGNGLVYLALNTFADRAVVAEFDRHFAAVLQARGLILDVRGNGGGSTSNGYDIIARLIDKPCKDTSRWRTRIYNATFRAWGRPAEWYEGDHGSIAPRGERPYLGPVVVLVGPHTFSAAEDFLVPLVQSGRAKLVGAPTGGSTGQPISVSLYQAQARICTKWDRFPDGREFVGIGVQPDVLVAPTRSDLAERRDPVLERAIALLKEPPGAGR